MSLEQSRHQQRVHFRDPLGTPFVLHESGELLPTVRRDPVRHRVEAGQLHQPIPISTPHAVDSQGGSGVRLVGHGLAALPTRDGRVMEPQSLAHLNHGHPGTLALLAQLRAKLNSLRSIADRWGCHARKDSLTS